MGVTCREGVRTVSADCVRDTILDGLRFGSLLRSSLSVAFEQ